MSADTAQGSGAARGRLVGFISLGALLALVAVAFWSSRGAGTPDAGRPPAAAPSERASAQPPESPAAEAAAPATPAPGPSASGPSASGPSASERSAPAASRPADAAAPGTPAAEAASPAAAAPPKLPAGLADMPRVTETLPKKPGRGKVITAQFDDVALSPQARLLAERLKCVCGCGDALSICVCKKTPGSRDMKKYLQELVNAGKTPAEVESAMVARYGDKVLP